VYQLPTAIASFFAVPEFRLARPAARLEVETHRRPIPWTLGLAPWALVVLGGYVVLLGILIPRHEPWFDEAQAWLLARDASPLQLLTHLLRYEGNPGLWHFILMPFAKLGFPYMTLNVIGGIFGALGVYVFLRFAPFPPIVKVLVPFSYFIFFQYAVVSRSYVMAPLFLFLVAATYARRFDNPYPFFVSLMLLALVSVHGMLIAGSLVLLHLWELRGRWPALSSEHRRAQLQSIGAFVALGLILIAILWPAADDATVKPGLHFDPLRLRAIFVGVTNHALTENHFLSPIVFVISIWWFWRRKVLLLYLVPATAFLLFAAFKYFSAWHEGFAFLIWLFALWISFTNGLPFKRIEERGRLILTAAMLVVLGFHVSWAFNAFRYDFSNPYSGSRAVASYIKANQLENQSIYATGFHSISILPYFSRNIFDNFHHKQNPSYWDLTTQNHTVQDVNRVYDAQPDVIIIGVKFPWQYPFLHFKGLFPGYRYVGVFPGELYWKTGSLEKDSFVIWRKDGT
jgi:hypothetical protein